MPQTAARLEIGTGRHVARHFAAMPDRARATGLLDEITRAPPATIDVPLDRPLALYGAGNLGRMARDVLRTVWLDVDCVIDRNAEALRESPDWQGIPIHHPDEVPEEVKRSHLLLVSVVLAPYVPIEADLAARGFRHILPFYDFAEKFRHIHPLSNGWQAEAFDAAGADLARQVLEGWSDEISRAHYLAFLAWRLMRQEWSFEDAPVTIGDRFFIGEVVTRLGGAETFLDAGAHHGSVIDTFSRLTGGRWKRIVAVEPDAANHAALAAHLDARSFAASGPRPELLACCLGAAQGSAFFHDGLGYASQIAATGRTETAMRTIDGLDIAPSFVKLHLEGHELEALKGARGTLLSSRPILAATVYHNDDAIWRTPLWLMKTLPDYRILFRLHSFCGTSAVIYAIPNERRAP